MTVKEFWGLKYGTVVENYCSIAGWGWKGTVVKREIHNECIGFIMNERETHDFLTGRKYLEITFDIGNGYKKYVPSNRPDKIKNLIIVQSG